MAKITFSEVSDQSYGLSGQAVVLLNLDNIKTPGVLGSILNSASWVGDLISIAARDGYWAPDSNSWLSSGKALYYDAATKVMSSLVNMFSMTDVMVKFFVNPTNVIDDEKFIIVPEVHKAGIDFFDWGYDAKPLTLVGWHPLFPLSAYLLGGRVPNIFGNSDSLNIPANMLMAMGDDIRWSIGWILHMTIKHFIENMSLNHRKSLIGIIYMGSLYMGKCTGYRLDWNVATPFYVPYTMNFLVSPYKQKDFGAII